MKIEFADLGDWGQETELVSEYDPEGPVIRINSRIADQLPPDERADFVNRAIAHELYHHMEHCGDIPAIADRAAREEAASSFPASFPSTRAAHPRNAAQDRLLRMTE